MKYFYDTNVLLHGDKKYFEQNFYISSVTLEELENIKTESKNQELKLKARRVLRWLINNREKYQIIIYKKSLFNTLPYAIDTPDKKIIATAKRIKEDIIFITYDLCCSKLAQIAGLKVKLCLEENTDKDYNGFKKLYCNSDQELAKFYQQFNIKDLKLNINEYLLLYDKQNNLIDKYKYLGGKNFTRVGYTTAESKMFGKVKPIDPYQELVLDSFKTNQLTLIKGAAGTGKSLLSLAYLFRLLEKGDIHKIIIFCNTVATAGSAKLGFYPGDRTQKLLDSQIGNFLISKLGAREQVDRLIEEGLLLLLPMSDIRGFDTSGMKAGIYITEAQNLNIDLMKLALQRIGEDSICILDGDNDTQVDLGLYAGNNNGLKRVSEVFRGHDFYGEITLKTIHRSKIAHIASQM